MSALPKPGLGDLIAAAFNARPWNMPLPPNWIALAAIGLLGLVEPSAWFIGAGLEVAYLAWLMHSPRFRATVFGRAAAVEDRAWQRQLEQHLARLAKGDLQRYRALAERCQGVLTRQGGGEAQALAAQSDGLSRLLWIYLRLLGARRTLSAITEDGDEERKRLAAKSKTLETQLAGSGLGDDLRKSLSGQLDIVKNRLAKRQEAGDKLAYLDAELARIEEQVELIREQAALASDAASVSNRIDEVAATLGGTTDWLREQSRLAGEVEDLVGTPPPLLLGTPPQSTPRITEGGSA